MISISNNIPQVNCSRKDRKSSYNSTRKINKNTIIATLIGNILGVIIGYFLICIFNIIL
jgi:F0F1-type ATP synthase assembly protein I